MKDYFHLGIEDRILFFTWKPNNLGAFIGSCFAIILCGILHEFLRYYRLKLTGLYRAQCQNVNCTCPFKMCCNISHQKDAPDYSNLVDEPSFSSSATTEVKIKAENYGKLHNINNNKNDKSNNGNQGEPDSIHKDKEAINIALLDDKKLIYEKYLDSSPPATNTTSRPTAAQYKLLGQTVPLWCLKHILLILFALHTTLSFALMLVFMTFNVWLCLATVVGMSLGYYIFFLGLMIDSAPYGTANGAHDKDILSNEITGTDLASQPCCQ